MNFALVGYGKMGRAVEQVARERGHRITAVVDPRGGTGRIRKRLDPRALGGADVAFEFTAPASAEANVVALLEAGVRVVCGTTGWDAGTAVRAAARRGRAGAVVAPNFSVGMHLFYRVVRHAVELVGKAGSYDPYVFEAHHRGKADAPSGTARRLAEMVADLWPRRRDPQYGNPEGALPANALHVASLRAGSEPGTHVVGFDGPQDAIVLTHRARGREGLALGAVLAGEWLAGKRGVHRFEAVLDDLLRGTEQHEE